MSPPRTAFRFFALSSCLFGFLLLFVFGFQRFGGDAAYPFLRQGALLLLLLGIWLVINLFAAWEARFRPLARMGALRHAPLFEGIAVGALLLLGAALRILTLRAFPIEPALDFRTFFEIAEMMARGALTSEGSAYCDYMAMFPHVYGYASVLAALFRLTGTSVLAAQLLNLALSLGTAFAAYRAARLAAGRLAGLAALTMLVLWPSQILYGTMLGSEALSTFLLMLAFWLYLWLARAGMENVHPLGALLLYAALGGLLAAASTVRPTGLLLLLALLLALARGKSLLPAAPLPDIPLARRFLAAGWRRGVVVLLAYLCVSGILAARIPFAIDREPAGGISSFGYNLLVGLNTASEGSWNEMDSRYLYDSLTVTGSADEAQKACLVAARKRLQSESPAVLGDLFMVKFSELWSNDDYGITWNLLFLQQQGLLNEERTTALRELQPYGNAFYLTAVLLAGIAVALLLRGGKGITALYPLALFFVGTIILHLFVENQNRYHFHTLPILAVLAGIGISTLVRRQKRLQKCAERRLHLAKAANRKRLRQIDEEEQARTRAEALRAEALREVFDLGAALREGQVRIVASEAYLPDGPEGEEEHEPS